MTDEDFIVLKALHPPGIPLSYLSTDDSFADDSDTNVPTEKAIKQYVSSLVGSFAEIPTLTILGRNDVGTGSPEALSVAEVLTMLDLVIGTNIQAWDADLDSLAAATGTHDIHYRSAEGTWSKVVIGPGLTFGGNTLSTLQAAGQIGTTGTAASAATLDLTGIADKQIEVTGTTPFNAIIGLDEGDERLLLFSGAGLTITPSATLLTPGGAVITTLPDGWGRVLGGAGGVVTFIDYQTDDGYKTDTFNNIFMLPGANIGYSDESSPYFDIGREPIGGGYSDYFMRWTLGDGLRLIKQDQSCGVTFDISLLATSSKTVKFPNQSGHLGIIENTGTFFVRLDSNLLTAERLFQFPDRAGIFALTDGETFTDPILVAPALGTPVSGVATNLTGLPLGTGVVGSLLVANVNNGLDYDGNPVGAEMFWTADDASAGGVVGGGSWRAISSFLGQVVNTDTAFDGTKQIVFADDLYGAGSRQVKAVPGILTDGTAKIILGVNASVLGSLQLFGNTSGSATIRPAAIAGTSTITLPNASSTLPIFGQQITFAGPTAARTITLPNVNFTVPQLGAANTWVGIQTMTSPALTTPAITGLATGSGVAAAATASTLAARDSSGDLTAGNLISATAGKGVQIKSGTDARAGEATLVVGSVTVSNSTVTNLSGGVGDIITLTRRTSGGTIGTAITYTISNGTSFTINSDNPLDTSTFTYVITRIN